MPIIYLSPSTQEFNHYVTGGTEEGWMNLLADAMDPILTASGIQFVRNTPDMTACTWPFTPTPQAGPRPDRIEGLSLSTIPAAPRACERPNCW